MDALIGTVVVVLIASIGGGIALIGRRRKSRTESSDTSYKAGKQRGTVDSKLDHLIENQGVISLKQDKMALEITESVTLGRVNGEGIDRLTERFDRHIDRGGP